MTTRAGKMMLQGSPLFRGLPPATLERIAALATQKSFRRGEIVCMAGLVGAGRTEVAETIFGIRPKTGGRVSINGQDARIEHPRDAIARGIAYVPEDRKEHGGQSSVASHNQYPSK